MGRVVRLSGHPFEIIGIAPEEFGEPGQGVRQSSVWLPSSSRSILAPQGPLRVPGSEGPEGAVRTVTVLAVAEDTDTSQFMSRRSHTAYLPLKQSYVPMVTVVARARTTYLAIGGLAAAIREADPDLPSGSIGSGEMMLSGPYAFFKGAAILAGSLGALTLVLAMAGLWASSRMWHL